LNRRSLLYIVPYSIRPLDSGARVRAFNLSRHIAKILDTKIIAGDGLRRIYLCYKHLLSSAKKTDAVYIEGFGGILNYFDYKFFNLLKGKRLFVYVRDVYWLYPGYFGKDDPSRRIWDANNKKEFDFYVKRADKLLFPTQSALEFVRKNFKGRLPQCGVLSAAGDPGHFVETPLPSEPHIVFVGDFRLGAMRLAEAVQTLAGDFPDIKLTLCGKCPPAIASQLKEKMKTNRWIRIKKVSYKELPSLLKESYLCVIPREKDAYSDLALPMKLFDYMAAGRPVVSTDCTETARILKKYNAGIVCEDNIQGIAKGIRMLIKDRESAATLGNNGRDAIINGNSWLDRARELAEVFNLSANIPATEGRLA
jgi:glycosyltransferase involved in cell wall biosynthesis